MADEIQTGQDLASILQDLTKNTQNYQKALKSLESLQKNSIKSDTRSILQLQRLRDTVAQLQKAKEALARTEIKAQKENEESNRISSDTTAEYEQQVKVVGQLEAKIATANNAIIASEAEKRRALVEVNDAILQQWQSHTILGKAYSGLTGSIAKMAGGLTLGAMTFKAFTNVSDAANTRMNIMIQNFEKMPAAGAGLTGMAESIYDTGKSVLQFETAVREAKAQAILLGENVGVVQDTMEKFARITGSRNPEALGAMTKAAITAAKVLNIDTSTAVEYAQLSIDKFGGSAGNALSHLMDMRKELETSNSRFISVKVRGDDLVKTIMDISRATDVYAVDQRMVGDILKDNMTRLQASGESYETARRRAESFVKATTSEAPEWMKIISGQNIVNGMTKVITDATANGQDGAKAFMEQYGSELEKAKPGLSKKVMDVLSDKTLNAYDRTRIIQELTAGTEVGQRSMSKMITDTYEKSGKSLSVIAQQFGISYADAESMVKSAQQEREEADLKAQARTMDKVKLQERYQQILKNSYGDLANNVKLSEKEIESIKDGALNIDVLLKAKREDLAIEMEKNNIMAKNKANQEAVAAIEEKKLKITEKMKAGTLQDDEMKAFKSQLEQLDREKARLEGEMKKTGDAASDAQIPDSLETLNTQVAEISEKFTATSILNGNYFKSMLEKLSSPATLLAIGGVTFLLHSYLRGLPEKIGLAIAKNMGGGGGGLGDLVGGGDTTTGKGKTSTKGKGPKGPGIFKRAMGYAGNKMGGLKRLGGRLGKLPGLAKNLVSGQKLKAAGGILGKVGIGGLGLVMSAMDVYSGYKKGGLKGAAIGAIPGVMGAAGGALGLLAGPLGGVLGASGGNMLGEKIKDYLEGSAVTSPAAIAAAAAATGTPGPSGSPSPADLNMLAKLGTIDTTGQTLTLTIENWTPMVSQALAIMKTAPRAT